MQHMQPGWRSFVAWDEILLSEGPVVRICRQRANVPRPVLAAYVVTNVLLSGGASMHRLQVHELFVEHLKKSKVNVIGAFILANDVNRLQVMHTSYVR